MPVGPTEWEQENKGVAQDAFNRAAPETQAEPPEGDQGKGSEMVESDKPEPALKPEGELRNAVDGKVFDERLSKEYADYKKAVEQLQGSERYESAPEERPKTEENLEAYRAAMALNDKVEASHDQDQSREQDLSPGR